MQVLRDFQDRLPTMVALEVEGIRFYVHVVEEVRLGAWSLCPMSNDRRCSGVQGNRLLSVEDLESLKCACNSSGSEKAVGDRCPCPEVNHRQCSIFPANRTIDAADSKILDSSRNSGGFLGLLRSCGGDRREISVPEANCAIDGRKESDVKDALELISPHARFQWDEVRSRSCPTIKEAFNRI